VNTLRRDSCGGPNAFPPGGEKIWEGDCKKLDGGDQDLLGTSRQKSPGGQVNGGLGHSRKRGQQNLSKKIPSFDLTGER